MISPGGFRSGNIGAAESDTLSSNNRVADARLSSIAAATGSWSTFGSKLSDFDASNSRIVFLAQAEVGELRDLNSVEFEGSDAQFVSHINRSSAAEADAAFGDWSAEVEERFVMELELEFADEGGDEAISEADDAHWVSYSQEKLELFADLVSQNRIAESLPPEDAAEMLHDATDGGLIQLTDHVVEEPAVDVSIFDAGSTLESTASRFQLSPDLAIFQAVEVAVFPGSVSHAGEPSLAAADDAPVIIAAAQTDDSRVQPVEVQPGSTVRDIEEGATSSWWMEILVMAAAVFTGAASVCHSKKNLTSECDMPDPKSS